MKRLFNNLSRYQDLIVGMSEKQDGSMKLSGDLRKDRLAIRNRKRFFNKFGINLSEVVKAGQVHGNKVVLITKDKNLHTIAQTDGLLTQDTNLFLTITVADCLPVFLYDPRKEVVGLIHCGWRSLAGGIIFKAIQKLKDNLGSNVKDILVGIGPGISKCHFEVKRDVMARFQNLDENKAILMKHKKIFLDLKEITKNQFIKMGAREKNIEINPDCTYCLKERYFSYRRDKPKVLQSMIVLIGKRVEVEL